MKIGPLQLLTLGFDNTSSFHGQLLEELEAVRGRGIIRLLDLLLVSKDDAGEVTIVSDSNLDEYGSTLKELAGLDGAAAQSAAELNGNSSAFGLTPEDVRAVVGQLAPGTAAALVLFEHSWAGGLVEAVREAGGHLLAQGLLTRDAALVMGEELAAVAAAESAIDTANAIKGAAVLDTLALVEAAEEAPALMADESVTSSVAAETLRTLMAAGVVDDSEIEPALISLVEAGLLSPEGVAEALASAERALGAVEEIYAAQSSEEASTKSA